MKIGTSSGELAAEIKRRARSKRDLVVAVENLEAVAVSSRGKPEVGLATTNGKKETFGITPHAQRQFAEYLGIPFVHYWRMQVKAPVLLAREVNRAMKSKAKERRMLRTLDGAVRALLSDRYRGLENEDLAEAVLPVLKERDLRIMSCCVSEAWLYVKAVDRSIERDVPTGRMLGDGTHTVFDTISPGIVISNSEVSEKSFSIETSIWTRACTNLAITGQPFQRYQLDALVSDETKRLTVAAIRNQLRHLVATAFDKAKFEAQARKLKLAAANRIEPSEVVEVVERVGEQLTLEEGEKRWVLQHVIEGDDLTRYGVHAAITRASADVEDYDRATVLERLGGRVLELDRSEWNVISRARAVPGRGLTACA